MFRTLPGADALLPLLEQAATAALWRRRQESIEYATKSLLALQRHVGLPVPSNATTGFMDRPYLAVNGEVTAVLREAITDAALRALPADSGAIDQWSDNRQVLKVEHRPAITAAYRAWLEHHAATGEGSAS